ncbi:hypothetical protein HPB52_006335 [Rhipicephalus sanguineus]|uniref:Sulfotransferase domain-containing protein n=1 Tax=Rhipicephalus sanguineus TaxID=34632 RepID=A0A9D4T5H5_RHISA|nr:hypothetical protein HPB52_006335 [Rhipicephalus sanguineus]
MRKLLGGPSALQEEKLLRELFLQRLPQSMVRVLVAAGDVPVDTLAEMADRVADYSRAHSLNTVTTPPPATAADPALASIEDRLDALVRRLDDFLPAHRRPSSRDIPFYRFQDRTFDDFFELFLQDLVEHGDCIDNVASWYEHLNDPNVFFLTYEDLKKDTRLCVLKIAAFVGTEWERELQENQQLLGRVLEKTSIDQMKKLLNYDAQKPLLSKSSLLRSVCPETVKGLLALIAFGEAPMTGDFVRKGQVGDWSNHFSSDQIRRMKDRIAEASAHSDFMRLWEGVGIP